MGGRLSASDRMTPRAQRASNCEEARRWFERSAPILDAAEREGLWHMDEGTRGAQVTKHLSVCG